MSVKPENQVTKVPAARFYLRPTLIRGPILTSVTAIKTVSGTTNVCWVARAAFGETDLRWMIFREWLVVEAPAWFRSLYIRHGQAVGSWLENSPGLQKVVRRAMMPAIRRTLRK